MSVYLHKVSETYHYDFQIRGRRFHGPTGCTSEREAKLVEKRRREEAREELKRAESEATQPMTWGRASSRYWEEVAVHLRGTGPDNALWSLDWLTREIGATTPIAQITNDTVARLVAKRRLEPGRTTKKPIAPATVNRSMTEPLRKVLNRAETVWEQKVARIAWKKHMLEEPQERVRELSEVEETRLFDVLREDYHPLMHFAIMSGLRLGEISTMRWADIDWGGRRIFVNGKGGKRAPIPLSPSFRDLLWPLQGDHEEFVFTYVARRTRDGKIRGQRYPITRAGLKSAFNRALPHADIADFRFHDTRHTTATRVLRKSGNLKVVQRLLRHSNIETTMRYAHVMDSDIMDAIELTLRGADVLIPQPAQSPEKSPETNVLEEIKALLAKASGA